MTSIFCVAQKGEIDSTAIASFSDKFMIKFTLETKADSFYAESFLEGRPLQANTNNDYFLGLSIDYEIIGLSIAFSPTFFPGNNDDDQKGESFFIDINPRLAFKKWLQTLQYRRVQGYYVENTEDYIPGWSEGEDPYLLMPNSTNTTFGMSTSFILNPNFSYKSIFYQTEWQKKSAGSFIPTLYYSYNDISFTLDDIKYSDTAFDFSLALAYYYTLVINDNWFIAPNVSPSAGVSFSKAKSTMEGLSITEHITYFKTGLESGIQIGYASEKIVFGVNFTSDFFWYDQSDKRFTKNNRVYGLFYFGYRFNTPSFIAKPYNKFAKKVGL